jgi:hypothetical protein
VAVVDWSDPCAKAGALTSAYYALLQGQQEVEIRTRTLDAEEVVRFSAPNLDALRTEMQAAASACAKQTGQPDPNRRFAITCGGARRPWGWCR